MSVAARLAAPPTKNTGGKNCSVCSVLGAMTPDEAEAFAAAMALRGDGGWAWSVAQLEDAITPYEVGNGAITKHRNGQCRGTRRTHVAA